MSFDITSKRAAETADIRLKDGDDTIMTDAEGNALTVTICGPASKTWQSANAEFARKRAKRVQDSGKLASAMDDAKADQIAFLCAITVKFSAAIEHPDAKNKGDLARAIYGDDALGFIRDQVFGESNSWEAFTKGSATA